jgi:hypothetical protein
VLISLWLSKGILFFQDNAAPHKAVITHHKLADLHFEVLKHPVYSPDLFPSDYYIFLNLFIKPKTCQPLVNAFYHQSETLWLPVWYITGVFPRQCELRDRSKTLPAELPSLTNPIITIIYPESLARQITHTHFSNNGPSLKSDRLGRL